MTPRARLGVRTSLSDPVGSEEQVARGAAEQIGNPPLRQVVRAIVGQVAALTEAAQVAQPVVGRIVIEVRGGQHDARRPDRSSVRSRASGRDGRAGRLGVSRRIVPARRPAGSVRSGRATPAALTHASGALEAYAPAELAPMRRMRSRSSRRIGIAPSIVNISGIAVACDAILRYSSNARIRKRLEDCMALVGLKQASELTGRINRRFTGR